MVTTIRASMAIGLVAALLGPGAGAAARAAGFETLCERALTSDAPEWFEGELARIDELLETGSLDEAAAQHALAAQRLPRTADISVPVKCVGRALYARWYEQGRRIRRARAEAPGADGRARLEGAVARVGTPAPPGAEAIADTVAAEPAAYGYAIAWLRGLGEQAEHERAEGRYVLDVQEAEARAGSAAADVLASRAKARTEGALAEEQAAFAGDASDADGRLAAQTEGAEAMASALAGLAPEPGRAETRGQLVRGRRVRPILREAGAWARVAGPQAEAAVRARALQRAEVFHAAGADEAYAFAVRDDHYALAIDLYGLADAEAERDAAEQARRGLRPGLAREEAERDAAIAAARARLEQDAEGMRQAAEEMEKSEAEKQSFDDEFDEAFGDMEDFFDE